jgi:hypothetical protein
MQVRSCSSHRVEYNCENGILNKYYMSEINHFKILNKYYMNASI